MWRIKRWFKFLVQRWTRGFDDSELWSLDSTIAEFVYPRIKAFRAMPMMGYPSGLDEKQWQYILLDIENAFAILANNDYVSRSGEDEKCVQRGMKLFVEYFEALWD